MSRSAALDAREDERAGPALDEDCHVIAERRGRSRKDADDAPPGLGLGWPEEPNTQSPSPRTPSTPPSPAESCAPTAASAPTRSISSRRLASGTAAAGYEFYTEFLGLGKAFGVGWIASFRSPANQAAQVSLVSGDATDHEDSVLSVDVDDVDAAYALARATGLLPDYDKCQAYIANVHSAFRSGS
jgi:hypothetical protein